MGRFARIPVTAALAATVVAGTAGWDPGDSQRRHPMAVGDPDGAPLPLRYGDSRFFIAGEAR